MGADHASQRLHGHPIPAAFIPEVLAPPANAMGGAVQVARQGDGARASDQHPAWPVAEGVFEGRFDVGAYGDRLGEPQPRQGLGNRPPRRSFTGPSESRPQGSGGKGDTTLLCRRPHHGSDRGRRFPWSIAGHYRTHSSASGDLRTKLVEDDGPSARAAPVDTDDEALHGVCRQTSPAREPAAKVTNAPAGTYHGQAI